MCYQHLKRKTIKKKTLKLDNWNTPPAKPQKLAMNIILDY